MVENRCGAVHEPVSRFGERKYRNQRKRSPSIQPRPHTRVGTILRTTEASDKTLLHKETGEKRDTSRSERYLRSDRSEGREGETSTTATKRRTEEGEKNQEGLRICVFLS